MDIKSRVRVKLKNPNPLFKKWLKELIDEAENKRKRSSQVYQRALDSLNKYPLNLYSGSDCAILENFGPKICQILDEKLEKHLKERIDLFRFPFYKDKVDEVQRRDEERYHNVIERIEKLMTDKRNETLEGNNQTIHFKNDKILFSFNAQNNCHSVEIENEIPEEIITSSESSDEDQEDSFDRLINRNEQKVDENKKKTDIKRKFELFSSSPISSIPSKLRRSKTFDSVRTSEFTNASPVSSFLNVEVSNSSPVAQSVSMEFNNDRELNEIMKKYGKINPSKLNPSLKNFSELTKPIKKHSIKEKSTTLRNFMVKNTKPVDFKDDDENETKYISINDINSNDYDIILSVDLQETSGKITSSDDKLIQKLQESGIKSDVRKLHIGDFLWIAKHKRDNTKEELVLPYIIERKRLDDLSKSIKDGRYHEQKFRLQKCGIENIIYVIENVPKAGEKGLGLPLTTLMQAATNTQIHSKFHVKFTDNFNHTIMYLTVMTSFIENIFKNKVPIKFQMMEFTKFNKSSMKQRRLTVRESFIKQLMVLKGLSFDIAVEITNNYPTPISLFRKYQSLNVKDGENLLSNLTIGEMKRKIPKSISQTLFALFS